MIDSHCFSNFLCLSNCWSNYNPHSNVLWLHYLADKLLSIKYKSKAQSNQQRTLKIALKSFQSEILNYPSATEALMNCKLFKWNIYVLINTIDRPVYFEWLVQGKYSILMFCKKMLKTNKENVQSCNLKNKNM